MTDISDRHIQSTQDAIPKGAVWLTEAYEYLASYMNKNPDLLPDFPGERWSETLNRSTEDDLKANGESVSKDEFEDWRQRRRANLLMRTAIAQCELIACVLHPRSAMVLQLHRGGWINDEWLEYIPWGIWSDFIYGDWESPGPSGTLLDGVLRPVFFFRDEYIGWLTQKFGERAKPMDGSLYLAANSKGLRAVDGVNDAITALWGRLSTSCAACNAA
jgi:hypothetical protein